MLYRLRFLLFSLLAIGCGTADNSHLFTQIDKDQSHVDFQNTLFDGEALNVLNYIYFYNGGGVAIGDINNDGLPDILFTGNMVHNRLFLNKGNFTFEDITEKSGIASQQGWCTGATMADINGDGKLDIYICRSADAMPVRRRNLLYINNGDLTFTEKAAEYGLADEGFSTQAAFFDYDKDGDLDLFLINHSLHQYTTGAIENPGWRKESRPSFECKLYRNDWSDSLHHPVYTDVSAQAGIHSDVLTFGLGLAISDLNNDGWPDIYVSNDFNEPDYLFMNNGGGTFTEKLSDGMDQTSLYSMGNDAADFNNDGLVDLMTLDMLPEDNHTQKMHSGAENFNKFQQLFHRGFYYQYSRNMLQKNNGDGTFSEIGQLAGVSNTDWSWTPLFCDLDNDGNKDLLITNGYVRDYTDMDFLKYSADQAMRGGSTDKDQAVKDAISKMPPSPGTSYLYHNNGNSTFTRANKEWGIDQKTVSAGAAYVDLDNDGALDLVINNTNEYAGIYRNNARRLNHNHYLRVALAGQARNGSGIGSKVKLFCKDTVFYQEAFPVRGFQSSMDPVLNFGTGDHATIDSLLVIWPDDHYQVLYRVRTDTTLKLAQKDAAGIWSYKTAPVRPLLAPVAVSAATPAPVHTENTYNDFDQQPLLLNYLSRRGPCMAKTDDWLFIGGTRGHPAQVFMVTPGGDLRRSRQPAIEKDSLQDDGGAVFFDANGDGKPDLFVAAGGYELPENDPLLQPRLYLNDGKGHFIRSADALPGLLLNSSCVKAADVDGDGDLDLFVGGRVVPNKYPLSPGSRILLNDGKGHFADATPKVAPALDNLGMVTDAVWTDLNSDGHPDLVVVGEWMPIKVFQNDGKGGLTDASQKYIRFPSTGWWNRIAAADLDGDGKPDLVLGNQGLNNQFSASLQQPLTLYYKDFNHNGTIDPIFCYYIGGVSYPAASRDDLTGELPFLKKKFLEYHNYADATITDLFTPEQLKDMTPLKAETLSTCWLQNEGDSGFVQRSLPIEAQYGPVYAIATDDINGDGKPDLLLAGGNQWTRIRFGRYRASHGVLLLNDGKGNFRYVPQDRSGLRLRDDVRDVRDLGNKKLIFGINDGPAQIILISLLLASLLASLPADAQNTASVREYEQTFPTYGFSDPNPIPLLNNVYPYFRFDGFTDKPVAKAWKVVELENAYIRLLILPEIGGKVWAAIEKSTNRPFLYYNHAVKFRDVAMRGPWTSGGLEANYGIIGHTPNCATPVDYTTRTNGDGSVSCIIGTLDLLSRSYWRMEIRLPKDEARFITRSFWYNTTAEEQPYYHWMNAGLKAGGDLEFVYPGNRYLGHEGEYADWPINKANGKNISWYKNNDFGGYKSYHVFGKYTDFSGAYWHDDGMGMVRFGRHDDKAGKKLWIWGLSGQGMIWEKLLTDTDGQYIELQSGRLFNQNAPGSSLTPFKHRAFEPYGTETWEESWYPVMATGGFVAANDYGALNVRSEGGRIKLLFSPVRGFSDTLRVVVDGRTVYARACSFNTLRLFVDSLAAPSGHVVVTLGDLRYDSDPNAGVLARPVETPKDFDWNTAYGNWLKGVEAMDQKNYPEAETALAAALARDSNYGPALAQYAMLLYRNMRYAEALHYAGRALSINTEDGAANFVYGLANAALGQVTDAKDGFDIAALDPAYRSAAYTCLARIGLREGDAVRAAAYAEKAIGSNAINIEAHQLRAIAHRPHNGADLSILDSLDPLNHFARAEKFLSDSSPANKQAFLSLIRNELPQQTFLELAIWYYKCGLSQDALRILRLAPPNAEISLWMAWLGGGRPNWAALDPTRVFPFRAETAALLESYVGDHWMPKYFLALIYHDRNRLAECRRLLDACGDAPPFAPFYAFRAALSDAPLHDLERARSLDPQWRYQKLLAEYYIRDKKYPEALAIAGAYCQAYPGDYVMGMLYVKALLLTGQYAKADHWLAGLDILPAEGATSGHDLYREAKLMQAVEAIKKGRRKAAMAFIDAARLWPGHLGVGEPYKEDQDLRLEEWLTARCSNEPPPVFQPRTALETRVLGELEH